MSEYRKENKEVRKKLIMQTEFYMITNEAFPKRAPLNTTTKYAQKYKQICKWD